MAYYSSTDPSLYALVPPTDVSLNIFDFGVFDFSWKLSTAVNCSTLSYAINAKECGTCPNRTTDTFVSCQNVTIDGHECVFSVQMDICDTLKSNDSESLTIIKKGMEETGSFSITS